MTCNNCPNKKDCSFKAEPRRSKLCLNYPQPSLKVNCRQCKNCFQRKDCPTIQLPWNVKKDICPVILDPYPLAYNNEIMANYLTNRLN